jgi:hypothetical protein
MPIVNANSSPSAMRNPVPAAPKSRAVVAAILRRVPPASPGAAAIARRMSAVAACCARDSSSWRRSSPTLPFERGFVVVALAFYGGDSTAPRVAMR